MKLRGRYVTLKGDSASKGEAILIRKITIELPEAIMHKLGSDVLKLSLELHTDPTGHAYDQIEAGG